MRPSPRGEQSLGIYDPDEDGTLDEIEGSDDDADNDGDENVDAAETDGDESSDDGESLEPRLHAYIREHEGAEPVSFDQICEAIAKPEQRLEDVLMKMESNGYIYESQTACFRTVTDTYGGDGDAA